MTTRALLPVVVLLQLWTVVMGQFSNEVDLQASGDTIKEFVFDIQHRLGMVLHNDDRDSATPILKSDNGSFYKRDGNTRQKSDCSRVQSLADQEWRSVIFGDGSYKKLFTINGQIPGPSIVVTEGTQVVVKVRNRLVQEAVTLHWHGMVQRKTPWMDGVGSVSQCPITPGETFTYRFLAYPAGTHWYHSHTGTTRSDGLFGALIVLPKQEDSAGAPDFDKEFIMTVHDWTREDSRDVVNEVYWELERYNPGYGDRDKCFYQTRQHDGSEVGPSPAVSLLINGKGFHFPRGDGFQTRPLTDITRPQNDAEIPNIPLETFRVRPNRSYRFRVIGTAMLYAIKLSIDQHDIVILSSDGNDVNEKRVSELIINTGERFDFSVEASQPKDNYWIRLETLETSDITDPVTFEPTRGFAVLHYEGADDSLPQSSPVPCTQSKMCQVMNCPYKIHLDEERYECVYLTNLTGNRALLRRFPIPVIGEDGDLFEEFINFHFSGRDSPQRSSVNGHQMVLPSAPPQTYPSYNPNTECADPCPGHCECTYVVQIPVGRVVQLTLLNMGVGSGLIGTAHPVHLHGHHFHVLKMAFPNYNDSGRYVSDNTDIMCENERCNNGRWAKPSWKGDTVPGLSSRPVIKDTVIVPVGGYVVLRFKADNPGYWFAHCHIEIHQVEGMSFIIKEGSDDQMPPVPRGFPTCGDFDWSSEDFNKAAADVTGDPVPLQPGDIAAIVLGVLLAIAVVILLVVIVKNCRK